jgi:Xaa-Pro dipeptidase
MSDPIPSLDPTFSRQRQRRLLDAIQSLRLDAAVFGLTRNVYYLTAHRPFWLHEAGLVLWADGTAELVCANEPDRSAAADRVETFEATWSGTQRQEQPYLVAGRLRGLLAGRKAKRVGVDASAVTARLAVATETDFVPLDEALFQLRRPKDPDELALMRHAIRCTRAMYERAREVIEPGVPELTVFAELHAAALRVAGEPLSDYLGNDYACAVPGGAARAGRVAGAGELYILDLGPAVRGYFSDNCRTFSVDRKPSDEQLRAWQVVTGAFPIVERMARPRVRCRDIFAAVDEHYRREAGIPFPHHLGHGVGLQPHEFPHLNPRWDDVLMEGEVFTVEPGLYAPALRGGMRIENQYRVTADGVENLTPFPMELA